MAQFKPVERPAGPAESETGHNIMISKTLTSIESELNRLDALDSETNSTGICVYTDKDLPRGWVRISDGSTTVYGVAAEILLALKAVEYQPNATVARDEPHVCTDRQCVDWHGCEPTAGHKYEHGHTSTSTVQRDNGWELAWEAIAGVQQQLRN